MSWKKKKKKKASAKVVRCVDPSSRLRLDRCHSSAVDWCAGRELESPCDWETKWWKGILWWSHSRCHRDVTGWGRMTTVWKKTDMFSWVQCRLGIGRIITSDLDDRSDGKNGRRSSRDWWNTGSRRGKRSRFSKRVQIITFSKFWVTFAMSLANIYNY